MSIETGATTVSPKMVKLADKVHGKTLNPTGSTPGQSQANGFLALLGEMELQVPEGGEVASDSAGQSPCPTGSLAPDAQPSLAPALVTLTGGEGQNVSAQAVSHELVMWLAQQNSATQRDDKIGLTQAPSAASGALAKPGANTSQFGVAVANDGLLGKGASKGGGLAPGQAAQGADAGGTPANVVGSEVLPLASAAGDSLAADVKSNATLHPVVTRQLAAESSSGTESTIKGADTADVQAASKGSELVDVASQVLPASNAKSKAVESLSSQAEALFQRQALLSEAAHQSSAPAVAPANTMGDNLIRPAERTTAKSGTASGAPNGDAAWGYLALRDAGRKDAPAPASEPVSVSSEWQVAQTVNYWVTQGVQNAELKLDGFGGQAVEVSISLKGDQAQVGFRTDQPEIRQLLEGAVTQLKDLLNNEGLVLSGVFVGNSSQQGAQQQAQRNFQGPRQTAVATVEAVAEPVRVRPAGMAGRSVDLFV